jgi:hypothetical protein
VHAWYCEPDGCGGYVKTDPLVGAEMDLADCNGPVDKVFTDGDGYYIFDCLPPVQAPCEYCLTAEYCHVPRGAISPYDASLVLRYLVCLVDLADCPFESEGEIVYPQRVAADVNCSGMVTPYDASLILQYVIGMIPAFPCQYPWVFFPDGACADDCADRIDFTGVLVGDVSGPMIAGLLKATRGVSVSLGELEVDEGLVKVPITAGNASDVFSGQFALSYDSDALVFAGAEACDLASGFLLEHSEHGSVVRLAMAGPTGFSGDGDVVHLTFERISGDDVNLAAPVLVEAWFDGRAAEIVGEGDPVPSEFRLGPAVPNPFTASTIINYSLARDAHIRLHVYDVSGRLVKDLFTGQREAGDYTVVWDGTDGAGSPVARGVYFCRMEAEGRIKTTKVVLLK